MGKIRARTNEELAARKEEIITAAQKLLMKEDYNSITLATIAENTSICRTSMYTYYETKESVFVDLMIKEYQDIEKELLNNLTMQMDRRTFCKWLTDLLWNHQTLLKLLSLQLSVYDHRYGDDQIEHFVKATSPYMKAMDQVLQFHFPHASDKAKNIFKIQYSVYCNSLYAIQHLPQSQMAAMEKQDVFASIPDSKQICFDGLMLLSTVLEV